MAPRWLQPGMAASRGAASRSRAPGWTLFNSIIPNWYAENWGTLGVRDGRP